MGAALRRALTPRNTHRLPKGDRGWTAYRLSRMPCTTFLDWTAPGTKPVGIRFTVFDAATSAEMVFAGKTVPLRNGTWSHAFGPYGVHCYKMK